MASSADSRGMLYATWHKIQSVDPKEEQTSRRPRTTVRIALEKGCFILNQEHVKAVSQRDEVFRTSPEFEKHKNVWVPLSVRLAEWTIESRKRNRTGKTEMFYYHPHSPCRLRSQKQVLEFIYYGFLSNNQEGSSSSEAHDNSSLPCPKRQKTHKEEVEAFLADAWNNLMNLGSSENQKSGL